MVKYTADDANGFQAEVITNGIARLHGHGSEDGAGATVDEQVQHEQGNEVNDEEEEHDDEEQGGGQHEAQQHNEQEHEQEEDDEEEQPHTAVQQQAKEAPKKKGHYEVHEDHDEGEEDDGEGEEGGGEHEEYEGSSEEGYVGYDDASRHRQKEDAAEDDTSEEN